jgi:benzoyl-CoA reductase/2-hydroxyglutaryl-CoA dehydratase subunit BcrC/BadD/HgdB
MIEKFREAASELNNGFVKKWKEKNKKIVGYTCSYVPAEVLHSAGILPYRIRGFGAMDTTIADTYFGPFVCSLPKCMLQLAGEGKYNFLDGVIITPGCDSMRRLDECWRKADVDTKGVRPDFFFHFGVPHKHSGYTVDWFSQEIKRLIDELEKHFSVSITMENLKKSIELYNKVRKLLEDFDEIRISEKLPITGSDALSVVLASTTMPGEEYLELLEQFLEELKKSDSSNKDKVRLMLVGSANDDVDFVEIIEGKKGVVVADILCFGGRFHTGDVVLNDDPIRALAERYLSKKECPRMYGEYKYRLAGLLESVDKSKVDGVVLQNIRFCDLHGSENGLFERDLEAKGIPCLRIEREYGPIVEGGRIKMRIDAFIERIVQGRQLT